MSNIEILSQEVMSYDAIIAVDESNGAHLIVMLTKDKVKLNAQREYDSIGDCEYKVLPGLYYANCSWSCCGGARCTSQDCARDCFRVEWKIAEPLFILESTALYPR